MLQRLKNTPEKLVALKPKSLLARWRYRLQGWRTAPAKPLPKAAARRLLSQNQEFRELSFTFAVIALSARIACANGPPTREAYAAFRECFPLKGRLCAKIRSLFALACEQPAAPETFTAQIRHHFPNQPGLSASLLDRLYRIAAADDPVSPAEEKLLTAIAHGLGLPPAAYAEVRARHTQPPKAHDVLGIARRSTEGALKKRYRELMRHYHPDAFPLHEMTPEIELLLHLRSSEIGAAYRSLKRKAA